MAAPAGSSEVLAHPRTGARYAVEGDCRDCGLCEGRTRVVVWRGRLDARVLFVGEGPGAEEDLQGKPFVGRSGKLLDEGIAALGIGQDWCITNIVRCRPPGNRAPRAEEMDACWRHLGPFLAFLAPRAVVAVGGTADKYLAAKGVRHLAVKHPAYFLRGFGGGRTGWDAQMARLRGELQAALRG